MFQPDALYRLQADGSWVDQGAAAGLDDYGVGRGLAVADLDEDGWLDVVTRDLEGPTRLHLARCGPSAWLRVTLNGPAPNLDAVGARVEVTAAGVAQTRQLRAGGTSYLSQDATEAWFGLGAAERADVRVVWPDGGVSEVADLATSQWVEITEPSATPMSRSARPDDE